MSEYHLTPDQYARLATASHDATFAAAQHQIGWGEAVARVAVSTVEVAFSDSRRDEGDQAH